MGHEIASRRVHGSRHAWRLAARLAHLLDAAERDVVWGDMLECRATGPQAARQIAGLVIRRQAAAWLQWQPWMALALVAVPLGLLLSFISRWWAYTSGDYLSWYRGRVNWEYLQHPAARGDFIEFVVTLVLDCAALAGWAWTCGIVLGLLSRPTRWTTAAVCCVLVFAGTLGTTTTARISSTFLYGTTYPLLLRAVLVVLPLAWGVRHSGRLSSMRRGRVLLVAGAIAALTAVEARGIEGALTFGAGVLPAPGPDGFIGSADDGRPLRLLPLLMLWPAAYLAATAVRRTPVRSGV